ncbi:hypothetical protein EZV73_21225 [Acidaminobacter sp. JC074]|uniref:MFS transporter n=1 Tax=Acidaminobacter sp. JC074 TaxID=2530199 RepID=UPI001F0E8C78|nr:glycoside-pentoside-hexuronide (GPH):cation symporter [Acidaminobacter sp. JC074]MCH4890116.1 hypothetical protein [Acidaminobacter sp. JC074]
MNSQIGKLEKASFVFGVFSQNLVYAFISSYIMIFYTDYIGISSALVGTIFFVARIWDAINDPMMGILTDRTRTRFGRFRPYLLLVSVPIMVSVYMLFSKSPISNHILWAYMTYILFGMIYTVSDIPLWSMASCMSNDSLERTKLISLGKAVPPVAFVLVSVVTVPLIQRFGDNISAYRSVGMIYAGLMMIGMIGMFFNPRERVNVSKEKLSVKEIFSALLLNKPLLLILASQVFIMIVDNLVLAIGIYYAKYNLGDPNLVTVMSLVIIVPLLISIFISSKLAEKHDKKKLILGFLMFRVIGYILLFLVGFENHLLFFIVLGASSLTAGAAEVLLPSMMVETIDFVQLKTGKRPEGIMWSTQTFVAKASSSVSGILLGFLLVVIEFVPNVTQSIHTLNGMHMILTLLPALCIALSMMPLFFYPLTRDKYKVIVDQLNSMKEVS